MKRVPLADMVNRYKEGAKPMMTEQEMQELECLIESASCCDNLTDWELEFIASIDIKLGTYGRNLNISEKQQEILDRIAAKL